MTTNRLEAFSDGVLAIILTIMVLELKIPFGSDIKSLLPIVPKLLNYVLSFIFVGIYWNNHHHLFNAIKKVNGKILWSNLFLLFWLSLLPVATGWMSENYHNSWPVAIYGTILLMCSIAFYLIEKSALNLEDKQSVIAKSLVNRRKENITLLANVLAIALAFFIPLVSIFIYIFTAILWIIPDKRIENLLD
jgi:uncharacterized membrane protein